MWPTALAAPTPPRKNYPPRTARTTATTSMPSHRPRTPGLELATPTTRSPSWTEHGLLQHRRASTRGHRHSNRRHHARRLRKRLHHKQGGPTPLAMPPWRRWRAPAQAGASHTTMVSLASPAQTTLGCATTTHPSSADPRPRHARGRRRAQSPPIAVSTPIVDPGGIHIEQPHWRSPLLSTAGECAAQAGHAREPCHTKSMSRAHRPRRQENAQSPPSPARAAPDARTADPGRETPNPPTRLQRGQIYSPGHQPVRPLHRPHPGSSHHRPGRRKVPAAAFFALRRASGVKLRRREVWEWVGEGLVATGC